jgi:hypothetical protein
MGHSGRPNDCALAGGSFGVWSPCGIAPLVTCIVSKPPLTKGGLGIESSGTAQPGGRRPTSDGEAPEMPAGKRPFAVCGKLS